MYTEDTTFIINQPFRLQSSHFFDFSAGLLIEYPVWLSNGYFFLSAPDLLTVRSRRAAILTETLYAHS